jgi:hypothetical protein
MATMVGPCAPDCSVAIIVPNAHMKIAMIAMPGTSPTIRPGWID